MSDMARPLIEGIIAGEVRRDVAGWVGVIRLLSDDLTYNLYYMNPNHRLFNGFSTPLLGYLDFTDDMRCYGTLYPLFINHDPFMVGDDWSFLKLVVFRSHSERQIYFIRAINVKALVIFSNKQGEKVAWKQLGF